MKYLDQLEQMVEKHNKHISAVVLSFVFILSIGLILPTMLYASEMPTTTYNSTSTVDFQKPKSWNEVRFATSSWFASSTTSTLRNIVKLEREKVQKMQYIQQRARNMEQAIKIFEQQINLLKRKGYVVSETLDQDLKSLRAEIVKIKSAKTLLDIQTAGWGPCMASWCENKTQ